MTSAGKLADGIDVFIDLVGRTISWLALAVAIVMGTNVFLRYGFSISYIWAQELEWHLLVPLTLVGMSYALRHGEHVRVDVLFATFRPRTKLAVDVISAAIAHDLLRARGLSVDRLCRCSPGTWAKAPQIRAASAASM